MIEVKVVLRKKVNPFLLDMIRSPSRKYRNSQNTAIFVYLTAKRKHEVNSPVSFIVCAYSAGKFWGVDVIKGPSPLSCWKFKFLEHTVRLCHLQAFDCEASCFEKISPHTYSCKQWRAHSKPSQSSSSILTGISSRALIWRCHRWPMAWIYRKRVKSIAYISQLIACWMLKGYAFRENQTALVSIHYYKSLTWFGNRDLTGDTYLFPCDFSPQ